MRLWSLHPRYLDVKGLVALWREGLLAQAVLAGLTRGYRNHPQLDRFREYRDPAAAVAVYLGHVANEANERGYNFDRSKLPHTRTSSRLTVSEGQLGLEWQHLLVKLRDRDPARYARYASIDVPDPHPIFVVVPGPIAAWERARPQSD
jgi:hypothetical protein